MPLFKRLLARAFVATAVFAIGATATWAGGNDDRKDDLDVTVLSGRADTITGGDALLRIEVPRSVPMRHLRVRLNGTDITGGFEPDPHARTLTGLVTGMQVGKNSLSVHVGNHPLPSGKKQLTNYPIEGPVFSGPHQQPYICATQSFNLPAGLGNLGPTTDPNCHIARRVDYIYRTLTGTLAQLPAGTTSYPSNMAMATTTQGKTVPYILRMETGTINRAIYQTMVLHDPLTQPAPDWQHPAANWNGRLIYTFGGGCFGGWYRQGASPGGVTDDFMLRSGYALASSSLNVFGNN